MNSGQGGREASGISQEEGMVDCVSGQGDLRVSFMRFLCSPNLQGWRLAGKTNVDGHQSALFLPTRKQAFGIDRTPCWSREECPGSLPQGGPARDPCLLPSRVLTHLTHVAQRAPTTKVPVSSSVFPKLKLGSHLFISLIFR